MYPLFASVCNSIVLSVGDGERAHSCRFSAPCLPANWSTHRKGGPTQCSWSPDTFRAWETVIAAHQQK